MRRGGPARKINLSASLTELENDDWGPPPATSRLVDECHRLRGKLLRDLTVEDLRLLIGQNIGLRYILPLALDHLERDPLVAGDLFPGDLLSVCLRCRIGDVADPVLHRERLLEVVRHARMVSATGERDDLTFTDFDHELRKELEAFASSGPIA